MMTPQQTVMLRSLIPQSPHHTSHLHVYRRFQTKRVTSRVNVNVKRQTHRTTIPAGPRGEEESCRCTRVTNMYFTSLCTIHGWDWTGGFRREFLLSKSLPAFNVGTVQRTRDLLLDSEPCYKRKADLREWLAKMVKSVFWRAFGSGNNI